MAQPDTPQSTMNAYSNPYRAQRLWPPDFSKMDPKDQFRLEKKYRRRAKLAYSRPKWQRGVRFAQYSSIMFVLSYGVFWMDWAGVGQPFEEFRSWAKQKASSIWTVTTQQPQRPNLGRIATQDERKS